MDYVPAIEYGRRVIKQVIGIAVAIRGNGLRSTVKAQPVAQIVPVHMILAVERMAGSSDGSQAQNVIGIIGPPPPGII